MCWNYSLEEIMLLVHSADKTNLTWTRKLPLILNPYHDLLNPLHSLMLPVHTTAFHIIREIINSFLFSEIVVWFLRNHISVQVFLLVSPPFPNS